MESSILVAPTLVQSLQRFEKRKREKRKFTVQNWNSLQCGVWHCERKNRFVAILNFPHLPWENIFLVWITWRSMINHVENKFRTGLNLEAIGWVFVLGKSRKTAALEIISLFSSLQILTQKLVQIHSERVFYIFKLDGTGL